MVSLDDKKFLDEINACSVEIEVDANGERTMADV